MNKVVIFSSIDDGGELFSKAAAGGELNQNDPVWPSLKTKGRFFSCISSRDQNECCLKYNRILNFDVMMVWEPEDTNYPPDDYFKRLTNVFNEIAEAIGNEHQHDMNIYFIYHNSTDTNYREKQVEFSSFFSQFGKIIEINNPGYSHDDSCERYKAIASVLMAAGNSQIKSDDYKKCLDNLINRLAFPSLYDQAAHIEIEIFRRYLQANDETEAEKERQVDLQGLSKTFDDQNLSSLLSDLESNTFAKDSWSKVTDRLNTILCDARRQSL